MPLSFDNGRIYEASKRGDWAAVAQIENLQRAIESDKERRKAEARLEKLIQQQNKILESGNSSARYSKVTSADEFFLLCFFAWALLGVATIFIYGALTTILFFVVIPAFLIGIVYKIKNSITASGRQESFIEPPTIKNTEPPNKWKDVPITDDSWKKEELRMLKEILAAGTLTPIGVKRTKNRILVLETYFRNQQND